MTSYLDESCGIVELTGRDRVRLLHGLSTNDLLLLATGRAGGSFGKGEKFDLAKTPSGRGCFNTTCNRQGKMIAFYKVRLLEDRIWLDVDRTAIAPLIAALNAAIIMDDVTVTDRTTDFSILRSENFLDLNDRYVQEKVAAEPFANLEQRRIEAGWPRWGVDMDSTMLPMEAGLESIAISYSKGCYLGQEVIQRVKTYSEAPRALVLIDVKNAKPGDKVGDDGRVTSATSDKALAIVRKEHKAPGTKVKVGAAEGVVGPLPWTAA